MKAKEIFENETPNQRNWIQAASKLIKRSSTSAALAVLALAAAGTANALPIKNGGFETGDLTGWSTLRGSVTSDDAYSGSYCLELDVVDSAWQYVTNREHFGSLRLKAKAACDHTDLFLLHVIVTYHNGTADYYDLCESTLAFGEWQDFECALNSNGRVDGVTIIAADLPVYIDNVALLKP